MSELCRDDSPGGDGVNWSKGANARLIIHSMVYDCDATGFVVFSVIQSLFNDE